MLTLIIATALSQGVHYDRSPDSYCSLGGCTLGGSLTLSAGNFTLPATGLVTFDTRSVLRSNSDDSFEVRNTANSDNADIIAMGIQGKSGGSHFINFLPTSIIELTSLSHFEWAAGGVATGAKDVGLKRTSAGVLTLTNGASGVGDIQASQSLLTAGTMTYTSQALARRAVHRFDWTGTMIAALGAVTSGDITICTLPARTVVVNAYIVITAQAADPGDLTMAIGRTGALYVDYIGNSDLLAATNTVYGDAVGERGANLTGYDLPSFTGTTAVKAHLITTLGVLSDTSVNSGGSIYLETATLP